MELSEDSEKQLLIHPDPLRRSSSPEPRCSDSESDADEDAGFPSRFCRDSDYLPEESVARRSARKKLIMAAFVSLVFMTGEVSLAIMTDAAHLLTDVCSISISCFSLLTNSVTFIMTFIITTFTLTSIMDTMPVFGQLLFTLSICTFLFSVLVLGTTIPISKDVFRVLMEDADPLLVLSSANQLLRSEFGFCSVTLQVER
ncbi:hypothetical protein F7725_008707 [Dissostichus mawsoni]|uniref:Uncharacterized protein n=1 Tax=Dissostichus mawsoni TaxID=36200 RepID=A0A7J5Y7X8_DISMA|nr:hypothetical protein F7725_008707 [Dissostichus mawsoni]